MAARMDNAQITAASEWHRMEPKRSGFLPQYGYYLRGPPLFPATIPPFLGWNRKANRQIMDELRWFHFYKITNKNNVCKV